MWAIRRNRELVSFQLSLVLLQLMSWPMMVGLAGFQIKIQILAESFGLGLPRTELAFHASTQVL